MARPRSATGASRSTMVKSKDRATSSVAARRAVLKRLRDEDIEHVLFWFTDLEGHLKSFAITPSEIPGALDDGMEREGLSERDAFARLRKASQISGRKLEVVAEALIATLDAPAARAD